MSHMDLRVEFLAGTDLYQAVEEAIEKAVKLDLCYVIFNFNGVEIHIGKNANYDQIKKEYEKGNVKFIVNNGG